MIKSSPLSGIYKNFSTKISEVSGWQIAENFGNEENELKHLKNECVLVEWGHVGKISISNGSADIAAEKIETEARKLFFPISKGENTDKPS